MSVAYNSGLIVSARVGKHTDALLNELWVSNQGKTDCTLWKTDEGGGYDLPNGNASRSHLASGSEA